jgi:Phosphatidylserine/phosphatidylglycerophosphate/cardiolipin synthases and related enzymes
VKVLVQPEDGVTPILNAITRAKKMVEIVIFRLDRNQIEEAIRGAAARGVFVRALVAFANRGGEQQLRQLETRFLDSGVTVTRSSDDLVRYHAKMMIIDRKTLYVLSYNYTTVDLEHSRAFGIVTRNKALVQEAVKLFEADTKRHPYTPQLDNFLVSPLNARKQLTEFIRNARKELLIYDPKISDSQMVRLLLERQKAGVEIKIIGRLGKKASSLDARRLGSVRLHTRTIIRDRKHAFVGSQSLRKLELDSRRELGLIVKERAVISKLVETFEGDWEDNKNREVKAKVADRGKETPRDTEKLVKKLDPLGETIKRAVKKVVEENGNKVIADEETKETLKQAVKKTVKQAFKEAVQETAARVESP